MVYFGLCLSSRSVIYFFVLFQESDQRTSDAQLRGQLEMMTQQLEEQKVRKNGNLKNRQLAISEILLYIKLSYI